MITKDTLFSQAEVMFVDGNSLRQIEKTLGLNRKKISLFLKDKGYTIESKTGNSGYDKKSVFQRGEELFRQGQSLKSICRNLNTSLVSFSRYLKAKGYTIKSSMDPKQEAFLKKKLAKAEQLYHQGITRTKIARLVNINDNILVDHFRSIGIDSTTDQYAYDGSAFEKIETEEQAYWLGFLYADGSITASDRHVLELTLKEEDYLHLVKFQTFLKTNAPVVKRISRCNGKEFKSFRICAYNKKIVEDLIRLGCFPRKSLSLRFPSYGQVPKHLVNHFVRGYFDGDGSIYVGTSSGHISIVGTSDFLNEIKRIYGLPRNELHQKGNAYSFLYGKRTIIYPFLMAIYCHATTFLDRKYERFIRLKEILHPDEKPSNHNDGTPYEGKLSRTV
jgi:hypothetical protein